MPAAMARVFIALWPDDRVRRNLSIWRDAWHFPRTATPVKSERLHVTLHFIGDLERIRLPALAGALDLPVPPFRLSFGHAALWPHGIAVLEPDAVSPELASLHHALAERLAALSLPLDARPYKPHVTMARRAANATLPLPGPPITWDVAGFRLMESTTGPDGGYTTLASYGAA